MTPQECRSAFLLLGCQPVVLKKRQLSFFTKTIGKIGIVLIQIRQTATQQVEHYPDNPSEKVQIVFVQFPDSKDDKLNFIMDSIDDKLNGTTKCLAVSVDVALKLLRRFKTEDDITWFLDHYGPERGKKVDDYFEE